MQLRLVEPPVDGTAAPRTRRARVVPTGRARRSVHWSTSWKLDATARRVGREGIAAARRALVEAIDPDLSKAS